MRISNSDAVIVIQIDFNIMVRVVKSQNRNFGRNQIEIAQKCFCWKERKTCGLRFCANELTEVYPLTTMLLQMSS